MQTFVLGQLTDIGPMSANIADRISSAYNKLQSGGQKHKLLGFQEAAYSYYTP